MLILFCFFPGCVICTYNNIFSGCYYVEVIINGVKTSFLIDTGATFPGLEVRKSKVAPVSITNQPITIRGETEVSFSTGSLETKWKFLVVDNLNESILGADFIESHHTTSWDIADDKLWLDDLGIPRTGTKNVRMVSEQSHSPVAAKCTVELPPRHQVIIA